MDQSRYDCYCRVETVLRWPMAGLAVLFTLAFVAGLDTALEPRWLHTSEVVQDAIWVIFGLEYVTLLVLAPDKRLYLRTHVLELLSVILPVCRLLRVVRVLRVLPGVRVVAATAVAGRGLKTGRRLLRRTVLAYAMLSLFLILLIGSAAVLMAERQANPELSSYTACLWWSMVTMTTVGYGDVFPITLVGKVLTMALMVTGIGLMGVVTAAIASFFVEIEREDEDIEIRTQLDEMSQTLKTITEQLSELRQQKESSGAA